MFRGTLVYPETVAALEKFLDKYGDLMDMTGITSSFSRCRLPDPWSGAPWDEYYAIAGYHRPSTSLLAGPRAVFGERATRSMESFSGSEDIRATAEALNLKQCELEDQHRELRALLLAQGVSPDGASCVVEAVTRSSHKTSIIPF
ncbi:hypothetical protein Pyn_40691 [Prunus yedoensis var. nudiflora]|uniref:Uncharacterized protein n=1 Tax=Prunus yedoensis var. nudiflora TaxID=2094558 RepID=A0A314YTN1_PRUYE|nr:hypothetical protein Pyn_40691 [Prunus yedoensis var. nudiflora]